ncbi:MAG: zonular occludens toxin domain-containing protein [Opitutus sp.]
MPIRLITGLPGHGKTLLMMEELIAESKKAQRPLYYAGIDGLQPGLAERIDNARDWNAIDPSKQGDCTCGNRLPHAHVVPDGSLIFVDEAWKWFGHLHDARGQQTPPAVLELAEHRHRGIDFVWTTQGPSQLYPFARQLVADHSHVVRVFGTHNSRVYSWGELNDDVKSRSMREVAISRFMRFDPSIFEQYKSATVHTIKKKIPFRLLMIPAAIIVTIAAGYFGWLSLHNAGHTATATTTAAGPDALRASAQPSAADGAHKPRWATTDDYVRDHTPRMVAKPWTAPIYDGRAVTTDPRLFCMISGNSLKVKESACSCYTEQATPYPGLTDEQCRLFARHGVYDPYIAQSQGRQAQGAGQGVQLPGSGTGAAAGSPEARGSAQPFASLAHYGAIHTQEPTGAPESYGDGEGLK